MVKKIRIPIKVYNDCRIEIKEPIFWEECIAGDELLEEENTSTN